MKTTDFNIGDIVEFHDVLERNGKYEKQDDILVGRISSIIVVFKQNYEIKNVELWFEYYCEMPGRSCVGPEHIIRVIEKTKRKKPIKIARQPIDNGQLVSYEETSKHGDRKISALDEVESAQCCFDERGVEWRYKMKTGRYVIAANEFKLIRTTRGDEK